jgi:hypothetical protein
VRLRAPGDFAGCFRSDDVAAAQPHQCATKHFSLSVAPDPANLAGKELETSPWSRPLIEDGAQSLAVKTETESVFLRKLAYLCFSLFLV